MLPVTSKRIQTTGMKRIVVESVQRFKKNIYRNNNLYHCHRFAFVILLFWLGSFNESKYILWPKNTQQKKVYYDDHRAERKSVIMFVVSCAQCTRQTQNTTKKSFLNKTSEWICRCKVCKYCLHLITDGDHWSLK